jgi:hypothetical protein
MAKFYAERVKLDRGGYDSRGRYWGVGAPLYLVEQVTDSGSYENARHVRAKTAAEAKHKAFGVVSKPRKPRTSRAGKSTWNLEAKIADARSVRSDVHPDFLPLFDHLLNLARNSAEHGYMQRAGAEIAKAKGFAKKHPKVSGDRTRRVKRDPSKSYRRMINGLEVTFTWHPKSQLWGAVIHAKTGKGTLPGPSAKTTEEVERRTRALLKGAMAKNDASRTQRRRVTRRSGR